MAILLGKCKLGGTAAMIGNSVVRSGVSATLVATATISAVPRNIVRASIAIAATAQIATAAELPSPNASLQIVTRDPFGNLLSGRIKVEQAAIGAVEQNVFVPLKAEAATSGNVTLTIPTGIDADYYFIPTGQELAHFIGRFKLAASGNLGLLIRQAGGQSSGVQTYRSVSGVMLTLAGPPKKSPMMTLNTLAIASDGAFITPAPSSIVVNQISGNFSFSLAQTNQLYSPSEGQVSYRMLHEDGRRLGTEDFTVPAQDGLEFSIVNGALVLE